MSLTGKPDLTTAAAFINDGFWPDLSIGDLLSKYRVPAEYADDTINWGLTLALVNVNIELEPVKAAIGVLGFTALAAYSQANPHTVNGEPVVNVQYKQAVYCRAKAFLLQQFNSLNRRQIAEDAAKEAPETEQWWLDQSAKAIKQLFDALLPGNTETANFGVRATLL